MEIFTLVTGLIYIFLEIKQKNLMWIVGVLTSAGAMWVFFRQGLYCSAALNTYYFFLSFWGLYQWRKASARIAGSDGTAAEESVHLRHPGKMTLAISAVVTVAGTFGLAALMELLENPMSYLDASVAVLSAVATWWLTRSYLEQWYLWIVANILSTALCVSQGMWWMVALYAFYTLSAVYGYIYWKKKGQYIDEI